MQETIICIYVYFLSFLVNCGDPIPPPDGSLGTYSHTRAGATVNYQCNVGFVPSAVRISTCTNSASWNPPPENHNCISVTGIINISVKKESLIILVLGHARIRHGWSERSMCTYFV